MTKINGIEECEKCGKLIEKNDRSHDYAVHTTVKTDDSRGRFYLCEACNNDTILKWI